MKRNDLILLISLLAYSYLFYNQQYGINYLIFSVMLTGLLLWRNPLLLKQWNWLTAATGTLVSSVCLFVYGNELSFIGNAISLGLLSAFSFNSATSVIVAVFNACYSYITSLIMIGVDYLENKKQQTVNGLKLPVRMVLFVLPVVVVVLFFSLYKSSNPLFENFVQDINLDFISWNWIRFTLVGFILLYAFFNQRVIAFITGYDLNRSNFLIPESVKHKPLFGNRVGPQHEMQSGIILFTLLNLLLLLLNVLDLRYMWFGNKIPEGMTYSEYLHQGTGALIASIVLAEIIILFYFSGALNFSKNSHHLKGLAYVWVAQNIFLVVSTMYRNLLYINEYSLTYKRVGVFVYLFLCVAGLAFTFIKIRQAKSNWYLFRKNGWIFYAVLVISCCFNWNLFISNYNLKMAENKNKEVDKNYLLKMMPANIPQLVAMNDSLQHKNMSEDGRADAVELLIASSSESETNNNYFSMEKPFTQTLGQAIYNFSFNWQNNQWQSFCLARNKVYKDLVSLNSQNKIRSLNLSNGFYSSLKPVQYLHNIEHLDFSNNLKPDLSELKKFNKLKVLVLSNCQIDSLQRLPEMNSVGELDLSQNQISELRHLSNIRNLETLDLSGNNLSGIDDLPVLKSLESLSLSQNKIRSFDSLAILHSLKILNLNEATAATGFQLPVIESLEELNLSNNELNIRYSNLNSVMYRLPNLKKLNLESNNLTSLTGLYDESNGEINLSVETLYIDKNRFSSVHELNFLVNLRSLQAASNSFVDLNGIEKLGKLELLNLNDNKLLSNIGSLSHLRLLRVLSLENNNRIRGFNVLTILNNLENLNVSGTGFSDLTLLSNLNQLVSLNLNNSMIRSLKGIDKLIKLENLSIENCSIRDYELLQSMKQLKTLSLSANIPEPVYNMLKNALPGTKIYPERNFITQL